MKNQRKRLLALVAMVLACIMVLPVFGGCSKKEEAPTTTAEEAFKEEEKETVPVTSKTPEVTKSNPNAESLQSTPNKGGNKKVTSGTTSVKSKYSEQQEALKNLAATGLKTPQERRDYAEAYMRAMLTVEWTLQERPETHATISSGEKSYYLEDYESEEDWKAAFSGKTLMASDSYTYKVSYGPTYTFNLKTGRTYRGMPFSQGTSGLEVFNLFVKEYNDKGVAVMDTHLDTYHLYGGPGVVGNAPDTALIHAWNTVSYTSMAQGASSMLPVNGYYFVDGVKLEEYTEEEYSKIAKPPVPSSTLVGGINQEKYYHWIDDYSLYKNTDEIVNFNGEQGMYAAYANLKKADGLLRATSADNHIEAKMVVSVNVVKDGEDINGDESYVIVLAQTHAITEETDANGETIYSFSEIDKKYTFKELFEGDYVPMTVKELNEQAQSREDVLVRSQNEHSTLKTGAKIYNGVLTGSRKIVWVNAVLTDESGKVLFNTTALTEKNDIIIGALGADYGRYTFNLAKLDDTQEKTVSLGDNVIAVSKLAAGEYHYKVTAHMITGEDVVVLDYDFEIEE